MDRYNCRAGIDLDEPRPYSAREAAASVQHRLDEHPRDRVGQPRGDQRRTVIQYSSAADATAANALTQVVPGAVVQPVTGVTTGTVDLILGSSFTGIRAGAAAPSSSPSAPSSGVSNVTKTFGGITGNTNICSDSGAFTGPDVPADFAP